MKFLPLMLALLAPAIAAADPAVDVRFGDLSKFTDLRVSTWTNPREREYAMLWLLNQSDGTHSVLDVAERARLPFDLLASVARELEQAGLLGAADEGREGS